jgi:hypothetical protein
MPNIIANDLGKLAQKVWSFPPTDVESKKELLHLMVDSFKFKEKQEKFHLIIDREYRPLRLDKLAADLMLADVDKVIK